MPGRGLIVAVSVIVALATTSGCARSPPDQTNRPQRLCGGLDAVHRLVRRHQPPGVAVAVFTSNTDPPKDTTRGPELLDPQRPIPTGTDFAESRSAAP